MKNLILFSILSAIFLSYNSCGEKDIVDSPPDHNENEHKPPADPDVSETIGFFLNDWKAKTFVTPQYESVDAPVLPNASEISIDASKVITKVSLNIFGQNSVSYLENLSDDPDLMKNLNELNPGVIRFPGGSISDTYFWNRDMHDKPVDAPDSLYLDDNDTETYWRWNYWYGQNNDINSRANLDDYYSLLQQTKSEGMITVNYAYARYGSSDNPVASAAKLAADWVRFDNGRTKFWEIGNENHGAWEIGYKINTSINKDNQPEYINGELYAKHAKVFIDSMKQAAKEIGKEIFIGVGVVETALSPTDWLYNASKAAPEWNRQIITEMNSGESPADFYIVHNYYLNNTENSYEKILASAENKTGPMVSYLQGEMKTNGQPVKPVALTEYNIFAVGDSGNKQQVSFVNGMHTTIVLGETIKNLFGSAIRWDLVNGWDNGADHGMFNKGDEPGAKKWDPRPVFYYMYYFNKLFGDRMIESITPNPDVLSYASSFSSGQKSIVLVNKARKSQPVKLTLKNADVGPRFYWYSLTGGTDNGDFSLKVNVNDVGPTGGSNGGPSNYADIKAKSSETDNGIYVNLPARSVTFLVIDK